MSTRRSTRRRTSGRRSSRGEAARSARGIPHGASHVYALEAGRLITVDGKPFVSLTREGDTRPVVADDVAHFLLRCLSAQKRAFRR